MTKAVFDRLNRKLTGSAVKNYMAGVPKEVRVVYTERPDKPTVPVTGVYGGLSSEGSQVVAHLFLEFGTVPAAIKHDLDDAGNLKEQNIELAKRSDGTREIQATIVMSPEAALSIGRFLEEKARLALSLRPRQP